MATASVKMTGGDKLEAHLKGLAERIKKGSVSVGFFEDKTYPDDKKEKLQRFLKGLEKMQESSATQKTRKDKKPKGHRDGGQSGGILHVAQVAFWDEFGTTTSPPRPVFRNMIKENSPKWGKELGSIMKKTTNNSAVALKLMGERIQDQLVKAITDWPADNAPLTVAIKGFNKGLTDSGDMARAVGYKVSQ